MNARVVAAIFLFFAASIAMERAVADSLAWESPFVAQIEGDWPTLKTYAMVHSHASGGSVIAGAMLKISFAARPVADENCRNSLTPAYTTVLDGDVPEIHICMNNYGALESYMEYLALAIGVFGNNSNIVSGITMEAAEREYFEYLKIKAKRGEKYCEAKTFLFFQLNDTKSAKNCVEIYLRNSTEFTERQREWMKTVFEGGRAAFNKSLRDFSHREPSATEYDKWRAFIWDQYKKWSYRAVILHEFGHIANGDLMIEGQNDDVEDKADKFAIDVAEEFLKNTDIPEIVLMNALFFMAQVNSARPDLVSASFVARQNKMSAIAVDYNRRLFSRGDVGITYSPFSNALIGKGSVQYARTLFETYEYKSDYRSIEIWFALPRSGEKLFYWDISRSKFLFANAVEDLF